MLHQIQTKTVRVQTERRPLFAERPGARHPPEARPLRGTSCTAGRRPRPAYAAARPTNTRAHRFDLRVWGKEEWTVE
uniref:Uncharacterized protein n=1 Tax=Arundo donax TaxID=35708 RepID=A0A0A9D8C0_ARUDO